VRYDGLVHRRRALLYLLVFLGPGCLRLGLSPLGQGPTDAASDAAGPDSDEAGADDAKPDGEPGDGGTDADAETLDGGDDADLDVDRDRPDADVDRPDADEIPLGPFGTPANVTELNLPGMNTEDPTLTDDLLEIVFSSTRPGGVGGVDIWAATRSSPASSWDAPVLVAGVSSVDDESAPEISGDGTVLILASDRPGGAGLYDLYEATRPSRGAAWSAPTRIAELSSPGNEFPGTLSTDRRSIIFTSSRPGGVGGGDLYEAVRASAGALWDPPTLIGPLCSADDDSAPWRSADARTIVFSSTRAGGLGDQDVWIAARATASDPWGAPSPVAELNGAGYDSDPWLSPDLRTIFYSRLEGSFRSIFVASR
jgi:hypothetical protein